MQLSPHAQGALIALNKQLTHPTVLIMAIVPRPEQAFPCVSTHPGEVLVSEMLHPACLIALSAHGTAYGTLAKLPQAQLSWVSSTDPLDPLSTLLQPAAQEASTYGLISRVPAHLIQQNGQRRGVRLVYLLPLSPTSMSQFLTIDSNFCFIGFMGTCRSLP